MVIVIKKSLLSLLLFSVLVSNAYTSGIHYRGTDLEKVVSESSFILQAEYVGEDKDNYGPHSRYRLKGILYGVKENIGPDLKVWAAHAEVWGMAMQTAQETGIHRWYIVAAYNGKGQVNHPERGKVYILGSRLAETLC